MISQIDCIGHFSSGVVSDVPDILSYLFVFVIAAQRLSQIRAAVCPLIFGDLLRYGIIASGAKGIAPEYSPYRKSESHKKAPFHKCLKCIG